MIPDRKRMAIHHAGHAAIQTLVGRGDYKVARVTMGVEPDSSWRGCPSQGASNLDREVFLRLYEFGLVTLAGIAAEDRYMQDEPAGDDPVVAISDLVEWQEKAFEVLQDESKVDLVGMNVMRKLGEMFSVVETWDVVEALAEALVEHETVEGELLHKLLAPLTAEE